MEAHNGKFKMTKEKGVKTNDKEIKYRNRRQNKDDHATKETLRK